MQGFNLAKKSKKRVRLRPSEPLTVLRPTRTRFQIDRSRSRSMWKKDRGGLGWFALFLLVSAFLILFTALSQASPPRSRGARPISLGNGYTAVAGDGYSLFYNPGGLFEVNQEQVIADFGRSHSEGETALTNFNGIYVRPWKWRERYVPLAFGFYGEQPAPGAHIIDFTAGMAFDAPSEKFTKNILRLPTKAGLALTIRHQNGEDRSNRVGSSSLGLGLTGGLYARLDRRHQVGLALRHLFAGSADPKGASISFGFQRVHRDYLTLLADLEYGRGGVWRFKPGMEFNLLRGVLRPRVGWGFRDNAGIDSVATGVGFYLSPWQIDIAYLVPVKTLNDNAGQFRASLIYRFGRPQFTEIYYDQALEQANVLDQNVLNLTIREAELKSSISEIEQKTFMSREELKELKARIEALKDKDVLAERDETIRKLKARVKELEGRLSGIRKRNKELRRKKATIRTHTVRSGDTLQNLAEKYYGDPNQWKRIFNANADKIERGLPRVGSKLVIP